MVEGILKIDLKGTKVEEPKSFLDRFKQFFTGQAEQEVVTQMQYLQDIYDIFLSEGIKNVSALELNGKEVYSDEENTPDDFGKAVGLALKEEAKEAFHVRIELKDEGEGEVTVNMYSRHAMGDAPLVIEIDTDKNSEDTKTLLENIKTKINDKFGIESGDIDIDEDEPDDTGEEPEEEDEKTTEEEKKEEATIEEEKPKEEVAEDKKEDATPEAGIDEGKDSEEDKKEEPKTEEEKKVE